jgi:hypothetical protein
VIAIFFEKIKRVYRNIGVQKDSETLLLKTVFNILWPCLRIWLQSCRKVLIGPKNFLLSKFEIGYQNYKEFHADSKTVEKNAIN